MVTATDPSGATDSIMVTISVTDENDGATIALGPGPPPDPESECVTGGAVADDAGDGLVADCEALLASEDALGGSLNWDAGTDIADWDGVNVSDGRVTNLYLRDMGLDGMIPASYGMTWTVSRSCSCMTTTWAVTYLLSWATCPAWSG